MAGTSAVADTLRLLSTNLLVAQEGSPSTYGVALRPVDPVVQAICAKISCARLHGARRPEQLHITLGALQTSAAEAVLEALQNCEIWQLAIAKCAANEVKLRTSRFNEIVHLV